MPGAARPAEVVDIDRHVVEPADFWCDAFGPVERARLRAALWVEAGGSEAHVWLNGQPVPAFPAGLETSPAGGSGDLRGLVRELDAHGIDRALLVPTRCLAYFPWIEDPSAAAVLAHAANRWWAETARALAPGRLLPVALIPCGDLGAAIAEVHHAARLGLRAAWICPAFDAAGRYPGHRALRPLWEALAGADLTAYVHPAPWCPPGSDRAYAGVVRGLAAPPGAGDAIAAAIAPAMDCDALLMALLADGLLEALPQLRLIFADAGAAWLPLALEKVESALWLCHQDEPVCLEPSAVFAAGDRLVAFDALDGSVSRMPERFARTGAWGSGAGRDPTPPRATLRDAGIPEALRSELLGGNARRVLRLVAAAD